MGNFTQQIEQRQERRERDKTSRETLGKFFYDLAKTTFTIMVLGNVATVFMDNINPWMVSLMIVLGLFITFLFAYTGNKILRS